MSFRGRGRGRGGGGSFGGGGFGGRHSMPAGPPEKIVEVGESRHPCEGELLCNCTLDEQVPYFNGRLFLENKEEIGKVDEILGPINSFFFSVKLLDGMKASSFKEATKVYMDPQQLLPLSRFLPKPPVPKGTKSNKSAKGRGGFRGRGSPSRGSPRGGGFRGRGSPGGGRGRRSPSGFRGRGGGGRG